MSGSGIGWNFNWGGLGGNKEPTLEERMRQLEARTAQTQAQTAAMAQTLSTPEILERARGLQGIQQSSSDQSVDRGVRALAATQPFRDHNSKLRVDEYIGKYTGKTAADTQHGVALMDAKTKNASALLGQLTDAESSRLTQFFGDKPIFDGLADYSNAVRGGTKMDMLREIDRLNQPSAADRLMDLAQIAAPLALAFM